MKLQQPDPKKLGASRSNRSSARKAPTKAAPSATADAALSGTIGEHAGADVSDLDAGRDIKGLGDRETIAKTFHWDGNTYHVVLYRDAKHETPRMVKRINDKDGSIVLQPLLDGLITCDEQSTHVDISRTRHIGDETTDTSFTLIYRENNGASHRTTIRGSELLQKDKSLGWMQRLGVDAVMREAKHREFRDFIRAIVRDALADGRQILTLDETGPVYIGDDLCWANACGHPDAGARSDTTGAVISPNGSRDDVRCSPSRRTDHYAEIHYPSALPADVRPSLDALAELLDAYDDAGVTGVLVGQLVAAPLAGLRLRGGLSMQSVSYLVGDSQSGKTAYAALLFTSQTRTLYGELGSELLNAQCSAPSESGGATSRGIYEHLTGYSGVLALLDDVIKQSWSEPHQRKAHSTIINRVVSYAVGGGAPQAQGNGNGKVEAADPLRLPINVLFTAECFGPVANLIDDSTYNRTAVVWWDLAKRCSLTMYDRLRSAEHTQSRNDGMRVVLDTLLREPNILADGYETVLAHLRGADIAERLAKSYARCLAGLHALDITYRQHGLKSDRLGAALPAVIELAQRVQGHGSHGGDQAARADVVEATRESARATLRDGRAYVCEKPSPEDLRAGAPVIPQPPERRPASLSMGDCGWFPAGESWDRRKISPTGYLIPSGLPGMTGKHHLFKYRVEMTSVEWEGWHRLFNDDAVRQGYRQCSREDRTQALITAGVMTKKRTSSGASALGREVYALDFLWLYGLTYDDVLAAENGAIGEDD